MTRPGRCGRCNGPTCCRPGLRAVQSGLARPGMVREEVAAGVSRRCGDPPQRRASVRPIRRRGGRGLVRSAQSENPGRIVLADIEDGGAAAAAGCRRAALGARTTW